MAPETESREDTPPQKRRRTGSESSSREATRDAERREGRKDQHDAPLSRTPSDRGSPDRYKSRSRGSSRQPSESRSVSRSRRRESSRSQSRTRSRSRTRYDSRSRSRSRSRSHSRSSRGLGSEYLTPAPFQSTPVQEPLKPDYRPRLILRGHDGPVSQVRISPNGNFIASASADGTIKLWDAETGSHMDTLVGHMAGVSCLAWSPDSNTLASGSDDKAIRFWDRVTGRPKTTARRSMMGQEMAPLRGHHNYIHCLAFSPKGNILASGSYDEAVFLWDVRAGRLMRSLPAHSDPVSGIDFCCDGTLVVSCSTDGLM